MPQSTSVILKIDKGYRYLRCDRILQGVDPSTGDLIREDYVEWIQRATQQVEQAMQNCGVSDWVREQRRRVWKWAKKVASATDGRWSHEILLWEPRGLRPRGRPHLRWSDQLNKYLRTKEIAASSPQSWILCARNRELWDQLEQAFVDMDVSAEPS